MGTYNGYTILYAWWIPSGVINDWLYTKYLREGSLATDSPITYTAPTKGILNLFKPSFPGGPLKCRKNLKTWLSYHINTVQVSPAEQGEIQCTLKITVTFNPMIWLVSHKYSKSLEIPGWWLIEIPTDYSEFHHGKTILSYRIKRHYISRFRQYTEQTWMLYIYNPSRSWSQVIAISVIHIHFLESTLCLALQYTYHKATGPWGSLFLCSRLLTQTLPSLSATTNLIYVCVCVHCQYLLKMWYLVMGW